MNQLDVASSHSKDGCFRALTQQKRTQLLRESSASKPPTRPRPASWGFVFCAFLRTGLLHQIIERLPCIGRAATGEHRSHTLRATMLAIKYIATNVVFANYSASCTLVKTSQTDVTNRFAAIKPAEMPSQRLEIP